jgi:hypothetical protein
MGIVNGSKDSDQSELSAKVSAKGIISPLLLSSSASLSPFSGGIHPLPSQSVRSFSRMFEDVQTV